MPTYDYKCKDCNHTFEIVQKMTDNLLQECPECDGNLKRLIGSGAGIIFQGSGFYCTDYRSDSYKQSAKGAKSSSTTTTQTVNQKKIQKTNTKN